MIAKLSAMPDKKAKVLVEATTAEGSTFLPVEDVFLDSYDVLIRP